MGDDHAISGAGLAIEQDRDSLMDYQTGAEYEAVSCLKVALTVAFHLCAHHIWSL